MSALWLLVLLFGCQASSSDGVVVLASSSLTDAFTDLQTDFQAAHPGVEVTLSFAGGQTLATQIRHGLTADVYASADAEHIETLHREGLVGPPHAFASNTLVLAVPADAPSLSLETLPTVERLIVGTDEVPIGAYTRSLFDAAQARYGDAWRAAVDARIASREPNVRLIVTKVAMGEADAAIVYRTDTSLPGVRAVALPEDLAPSTTCWQGSLTAAAHPALAQAWVDFVSSPAGLGRLAQHGFLAAP